MEMGLLHGYFGHFSVPDERYYLDMDDSAQGEIECTQGENEMNIIMKGGGNRSQGQVWGSGLGQGKGRRQVGQGWDEGVRARFGM